MGEYRKPGMDRVLGAVADPTRRPHAPRNPRSTRPVGRARHGRRERLPDLAQFRFEARAQARRGRPRPARRARPRPRALAERRPARRGRGLDLPLPALLGRQPRGAGRIRHGQENQPEETEMNAVANVPALTVRREIAAPAAALFDAWLDADKPSQWMRPMDTQRSQVKLDARVGGEFEIVMYTQNGAVPHTGIYQEITRP